MRSSRSAEELAREWSLSFLDLDFVNTKPTLSRLGVAVQLKFFASRGARQPRYWDAAFAAA